MTKVVAIIPCYKVRHKIEAVLNSIDPSIRILCVDDACPEGSGKFVEMMQRSNVTVLYNAQNLGVGGAVKAGYAYGLAQTDGEVFVKIDGDGQMPGEQIGALVSPLVEGRAEYVKGNRFYYLNHLKGMPMKRLLGNVVLSFFTKLSSGYWDVMDPTNGFTAIARAKLEELDLNRIDNRYFFESDMLCNLYLLNTQVRDFPMKAVYADETSSLRVHRVTWPFFAKNMRNTLRRIVYTYFIRDFNAGSLALLLSIVLAVVGLGYGLGQWAETFATGLARPTGSIMLAALSLIFSVQFLLFFLTVDMQNNPNQKRR